MPQPEPFSAAPAGHMKQLDGLRALAVAAVIYGHWLPEEFQLGVPWGSLGVLVFFVLSGFLITGILLDCRPEEHDFNQTRFALRQFYVRRFLRIFPLYYMTLLWATALNVSRLRESWPWHAAYLSNFYDFHRADWGGSTSHFWSLAVEEQFYLAWPWLILLTPRRFLLGAIALTILVAPLCRAVTAGAVPDPMLVNVLTFNCLDALGFGALLSYLVRHRQNFFWRASRLWVGVMVAGLPAWVAVWALQAAGLRSPIAAVGNTFIVFFFGCVVLTAGSGCTGFMGRFLQARPMVYLGKISYGLYMFHNFADNLASLAINYLHLPRRLLDAPVERVLTLATITLLAASLSWHLYERPINDLKRFFPYRRST